MTDLRLRVCEIDLFEQAVSFLKPFRFGAFSLNRCPQVFVRIRVEAIDGRKALGGTAELAVPRWFDKSIDRSPEENIQDLFSALRAARTAYLALGRFQTVFEMHLEVDEILSGSLATLPALVRSFGLAQIEKALIDATCRLLECSFERAVQANVFGLHSDSAASQDLEGIDLSRVLATLKSRPRLALRHTVGFAVPGTAPHDLLSLTRTARQQGLRYLKIKLSGDVDMDIARLLEISSAFGDEGMPEFSLDGNEQYSDAGALVEVVGQLAETNDGRGRGLDTRCLFLEQPLPRELTLSLGKALPSLPVPIVIDEADDHDLAFSKAIPLGYNGVSSKACKGVVRALLNIVRTRVLGANFNRNLFVTPEDLCTQPGWALQQDLALAALSGSTHVEKNGHQYVLPLSRMDSSVRRSLQRAAPDLYSASNSPSEFLRISDGDLSLGSVNRARGFGGTVFPPWIELSTLASDA